MKTIAPLLIALAGSGLLFGAAVSADDAGRKAAAVSLAHDYLLIDTHIDVPERLEEDWEDVSKATQRGDFDYERARLGGLDVPFMSIYTPAESEAEGTSFALANRLIDRVEALV